MIKRLLFLSLLFISLSASAQDWQWTDAIAGSFFSGTIANAADKDGNTYVLGKYGGEITIGNQTLSGYAYGNIYVVKYDRSGKVTWVKNFNSQHVMAGRDIAVDGAGNVYVTGLYKGEIGTGGIWLRSDYRTSAFIIKYDTNGKTIWAKQVSSNDGDVEGLNVTADKNGNAYLTGNFMKSVKFGSGTVSTTNNEQLFIAKYDAAGGETWIKLAGGLGTCATYDIITDANGNLLLTGAFWMTASFGATTLTNNTQQGVITKDIFLAKYDANGNALWAKQAGGSQDDDVANGLTVDSHGNSYITGYFNKIAIFGNDIVTGNTSTGTMYLASYNVDGNLRWVQKQEASGEGVGMAITSDSNDNLYVAGNFTGSTRFADSTYTSQGDYDAFIAKYSSEGIAQSVTQVGSTGVDVIIGLSVSNNGRVHFSGDFNGDATIGTSLVNNAFILSVITGTLKLNTSESELAIATLAVPQLLCEGGIYNVNFLTNGLFTSKNTFSVQLSDETGSFTTPIEIGEGGISPISVKIPDSLKPGSSYRMRVISTHPGKAGADNGADITIEIALQQPGQITGNPAMCVGTEEVYTVPAVIGATTYTWQVPTGWTIKSGQGTTTLVVVAGSTPGAISVTASNSCHTSPKREILVTPKAFSVTASVTSSSIPAGSSTFLMAKGADSYTWEPATGLSNANIANPVATPARTTTYTVTGYKDGCTEMAQVTITIKEGVNPSNWVWANQGGNSADAIIESKAITTDTEGNIYVIGDFRGEVSFGGVTLNAPGYIKTFVVKYTPQGAIVWAKEGASQVSHVTSVGVTTDSYNNVYVAGEFSSALLYNYKPSTVTFNTSTLSAETESSEIYIIKYDKDGNMMWLKSAGGNSEDKVKSIAADREGNFYITGSYYIESKFGSYTVSNTNTGTGAFIARYNTNGVAVWANRIDTGIGIDVVVDDNGEAFVGGHYNAETAGPFVARYTTSGDVSWIKRMVWSPNVGSPFVVSSIALDKHKNAYITGSLNGSLDFGEFSTTAYDEGIFLAKLDVQGKALWAVTERDYQHGGTRARDIAIGTDENIYLTGEATYFPEMDGWYPSGTFLAKYSPLGNLIGANVINVRGDAYGNGYRENKGTAIAIDNLNNIYLTGAFKNEIDLSGAMSLLTAGQEYWHQPDFFLAKARSVAPLPKPIITIGELPSTHIPCDYSISELKIPFTTKGRVHRDNIYNAYLLDKDGRSLGLIGSGTSSPIIATIPSSTVPGAGYKIIVEATSPGGVISEGKEITLIDFPVPTHITGETNTCVLGEYEYSVPWQNNIIEYKWTIPEGWYLIRGIYSHGIVVMAGMNPGEGNITVEMRTNCGQVYTRSLHVKSVRTDVFPDIKIETICGSNKVKLTASGAPEGGTYNWYTYGNNPPIHTGEVYTPEATEAKTFYVAIKINGCEGPRKVISVMAYPIPTVTAGPDETICSDIESLQLTGFSPETHGYWSGVGVLPNGKFYPKSVGPGVYTLTYTYTYPFECAYPATKTITVSNCTGIPESKLTSKLVVYPNPAKTDVTIELPLPTGTDVRLLLIDAKGQKLYEQNYEKVHGEFRQILNIKDKPKGLYLLQLILSDGMITRRVVVE